MRARFGTRRPSATALLLIASALVMVTAGVRGLLTPSATVEDAIQGWALLLAFGYIAGGITTALGTVTDLRRVESVGLVSLSLLSLLHGTLIIYVASDSADLTAIRIIAAAFTLLALAAARWDRGISRRDIARIDQIHTDLTTGGES